jgi:hypothetical protein
MHTTENQCRSSKCNTAAFVGLLVLTVFALQARAAEQPKPGPEHKKMEAWVGQWTIEGTAEPSPFGPAGKFKGKQTTRMVLGGFFCEMREEGKDATGSSFQYVALHGYDAVSKTYVDYGFGNDGTVTTGSTTVSGNTWTQTSAPKDSKGTTYKARWVGTISSDGRAGTFSEEYSADDGKTWLPLSKGTLKRAKK